MNKANKSETQPARRNALMLVVAWIAVVLASLSWNLLDLRRDLF